MCLTGKCKDIRTSTRGGGEVSDTERIYGEQLCLNRHSGDARLSPDVAALE